jgi:hypothetical protein
MAKKTVKLSSEDLEKRRKAIVYVPADDPRCFDGGTLYGEPWKIDDQGRTYFAFPAYPEFIDSVKNLHPNWEYGGEFVDMSGLEGD